MKVNRKSLHFFHSGHSVFNLGWQIQGHITNQADFGCIHSHECIHLCVQFRWQECWTSLKTSWRLRATNMSVLTVVWLARWDKKPLTGLTVSVWLPLMLLPLLPTWFSFSPGPLVPIHFLFSWSLSPGPVVPIHFLFMILVPWSSCPYPFPLFMILVPVHFLFSWSLSPGPVVPVHFLFSWSLSPGPVVPIYISSFHDPCPLVQLSLSISSFHDPCPLVQLSLSISSFHDPCPLVHLSLSISSFHDPCLLVQLSLSISSFHDPCPLVHLSLSISSFHDPCLLVQLSLSISSGPFPLFMILVSWSSCPYPFLLFMILVFLSLRAHLYLWGHSLPSKTVSRWIVLFSVSECFSGAALSITNLCA